MSRVETPLYPTLVLEMDKRLEYSSTSSLNSIKIRNINSELSKSINRQELLKYSIIFLETEFCCTAAPSTSFSTPILLPQFLLNVMNRTRSSNTVLITSFLYLKRLKIKHPHSVGSAGCGHRMFLSSLLLASKYLYDDTYDNTAWAQVSSGLFDVVQINHMERELLSYLNYELYIQPEDWHRFTVNLLLKISLSSSKYSNYNLPPLPSNQCNLKIPQGQ